MQVWNRNMKKCSILNCEHQKLNNFLFVTLENWLGPMRNEYNIDLMLNLLNKVCKYFKFEAFKDVR